MDGVRPGLRRQPPAAGADTREILAAAGVAAAEIDRPAAVGTIDLGVAETSLRAAG